MLDVDSNWMVSDGAPRERWPGGSVLPLADAYWLASTYSGAGNLLDGSGGGRPMIFGAAAAAPLFLPAGPYLYLPGIAQNYAWSAADAAMKVTGAIDVRGVVVMDNYTPAANATTGGRWVNTTPDRSYRLEVTNAKLLLLRISPDGVANDSIASSAVIPAANLAQIAIKATWRPSDQRVQFFTSTDYNPDRDTGTWTQLGTDRTMPGAPASIFPGTAAMEMGATQGATQGFWPGRLLRWQVFDGIGGTKVYDADYTTASRYDAARTSATAVTGQAITIARASSGRKTSVPDRNLFLLGTDDYFEAADDPLFNFTNADTFSLAVGARVYGGAVAAVQAFFAKKSSYAAGAGYFVGRSTTPATIFRASDAANNPEASAGDFSPGLAAAIGAVQLPATLQAALSGVAGATTPNTNAATLLNALGLRIGAASGGSAFADAEILGAALFRNRALTAADFAQLAYELGAY